MRAVIQRVNNATVSINEAVVSEIENGLLVLIGFCNDDSIDDIDWITNKITNMRILPDENQLMNLSLKDVDGDLLLVSQFTLFASTKKGNRPSFISAAKPDIAIPLYKKTIEVFNSKLNKTIKTGKFGADMKIYLINDGPVTICIDSKARE